MTKEFTPAGPITTERLAAGVKLGDKETFVVLFWHTRDAAPEYHGKSGNYTYELPRSGNGPLVAHPDGVFEVKSNTVVTYGRAR